MFNENVNFNYNKPYIFYSNPNILSKRNKKKKKIKDNNYKKIYSLINFKNYIGEKKNLKRINYQNQNNYMNYGEKIFNFNLIKDNNETFEIRIKLNENKKLIEVLKILVRRNYLLNKESKSYKFYLKDKIINYNFSFKDLYILEKNIITIQNCNWKKIKNNYFLHTKDLIKKPKYMQSIPSYEKLLQMSNLELSRIKNFTLYNNNGIIEFLGYSDLRNLDLDEIVQIDNKTISIYENLERPLKGMGLNKPAFITILNICSRNNLNLCSFKKKLAKKIKKMNGKLLLINTKENLIIFKIDSF